MEDIEDAAQFLAYKKAIDDALAKDLEDPQLWLLRGNAEEANASGRGQRGECRVARLLRGGTALVPDHASAHHYLVHSYETIGRIDEALEHGEAFARLSPSIPHAAHMWATTCVASAESTKRSRSSSRRMRSSASSTPPRRSTPRWTGTTATTSTCWRAATSTRDR